MNRSRMSVLTVFVAIAAVLGVGIAMAGVTDDPPPRIAFVANGYTSADALAAGPAGGRFDAPIFTTTANDLSPAAVTGLANYDPDLVFVLGGPLALSDEVYDDVVSITGLTPRAANTYPTNGVVRTFGPNRTATAEAISRLWGHYNPTFPPQDDPAIPIAMGYLNRFDGEATSGVNVTSATWNASLGRWEVELTGISYFYNDYITLVTLASSRAGMVMTDSVGGDLLIYTYDETGASEQRDVAFTVYQAPEIP